MSLHDAFCDACTFTMLLMLAIAFAIIITEWIIGKVTANRNNPYRREIRRIKREIAEIKKDERREKAAYRYINRNVGEYRVRCYR